MKKAAVLTIGIILLASGIVLAALGTTSFFTQAQGTGPFPLSISGVNNWITVDYCYYKDAHTLLTEFSYNHQTVGFQLYLVASGSSSQENIGTFNLGTTTTTLTTTNVDLTGVYNPATHTTTPAFILYREENSSGVFVNSLRVDVAAAVYSHVTVSSVGQGTTTPSGTITSTYLVGGDLWVTVTPTTGWMLNVMQRNGANWTSANPGGFLNLAATENITVIFVQTQIPVQNYSLVTITVVGQGTTNPGVGSYSQTYHIGDTISITAIPSDGWEYNLTKRNGAPETGSNPAGIANLGTTENIEVDFSYVGTTNIQLNIIGYAELISGVVMAIAGTSSIALPFIHKSKFS